MLQKASFQSSGIELRSPDSVYIKTALSHDNLSKISYLWTQNQSPMFREDRNNGWESLHLGWFDFLAVDTVLFKMMERALGEGSEDMPFIRHSWRVQLASVFPSVSDLPTLRYYYEHFIFTEIQEHYIEFSSPILSVHTHKKLIFTEL